MRQRILMNEQDGSPGGGAAAVPPAQLPATPAVAQPTLTIEDIKSTITNQFTELSNGFFANLRKTGALKTEKPTAQPAAEAAPGITAADVDMRIARAEALTTLKVQHGISDGAFARMKAAMAAENPADPVTWAISYASDMGLTKAPPAQPAAPAATVPATPAVPVPAAAPAAPSAHALPTANGMLDLFSMTRAQHVALGPKGVRDALEKAWAIGNQMSGAPERPKPPGQR
jgi:hypothetical protein